MDFLILVLAPLLRNLTGWLERSLKDGQINKYEWKKLFETSIRVGVLGLVAYFGLESAGIDNPELISLAVAFFSDKLFKN
jgi:hypothetical protein